MSHEEAEILSKRAGAFLENAGYLISIGSWDLATFNLEQYCQLALKHKLLLLTGAYPRTHSIQELLSKISQLDASVNKLLKTDINLLYVTKLEDAYIVSRYIPRSYSKEETIALHKFVREMFKPIVDNIRIS